MTRNPFLLAWALSFAVILIPPQASNAATIFTDANCSLAEAIESANTNAAAGGCNAGAAGSDTVVVTTNVVLSTVNNGANGLPVVTEDLVIASAAPGTFITRDFTVGTPEFRILEIGTATVAPSVTVSRVNMNNGRVTGSGGCIYLRNGSLTVANSVLQECLAVGLQNAAVGEKGGAIFAAGETLRVTDSSFSFNQVVGAEALTAGVVGGAAQGGAIYASVTSLVLESTTFDSNFAIGGAGVSSGGLARGGAVAFAGTGGSGSIARSIFTANGTESGAASNGNSGLSAGGAIAVIGGATLTLTDSDLTSNVANGQASPSGLGGNAQGGALYASASTLTLGELDISGNRSTGGQGQFAGTAGGGGLYLSNTTAIVDAVQVESNSVSGGSPNGGGIFYEGSAATPLLITHSTLAYNDAISTSGSAAGGGLFQAGDTVTIRNTALFDNNADVGGGLFQDHGTAVVTRSTFSTNAANTYGGAVAVDGSGFFSHTVELANVTISGNSAGIDGGGLYITGAPLAPNVTAVLLNNTTVTNNNNGGVYLVHGHTDPELAAGNSIIGAQASGADCSVSGTANLTSHGGNLESGTSCAFTATSDQQSVADLGLSAIGNHGGETLTHELLPGSPAIDSGSRRICNRRINGKDQPGLARFYDGNGDRAFDCDSGAVEFQGLLANPGFEEPLSAANDWLLVTSGGGDGRVRSTKAPSGRFVVVLQANGARETLAQTVPVTGDLGQVYTLTLLAFGSGLTAGEAMDVTVESKSGGTPVDSETCSFRFPSPDFSGSPAACELTTTGAYDSLGVTIGWDGPTTGSLALDAVSLNRR